VLAADDQGWRCDFGGVEFVVVISAPEVGLDGVCLQGFSNVGVDGLLADGSGCDEVAGSVFGCVCFSLRNDVVFVLRKHLIAQTSELEQHTIIADGHPIALWEKSASNADEAILLVHGLTWSAIPDFDLQVEGEDLSLMDGLVDEGYATYAIDLRGYGQTPRDDSGWLTPDRTAKDLKIVLK